MIRSSFPPAALLALCLSATALSQNADVNLPRRAMITRAIDDHQRVVLKGNTRSAATPANDRGRVSDGLVMDHLLLQLQRSPEAEQAVQQYTDDLQNPASSNFHRWLTPAQFGQRFGAAQVDIDKIANWLESQGFVVNQVYPSNLLIDFSGTAGQVSHAFAAEIHNLETNGEAHIGNMTDPDIPAALASVVTGIVSLHNFRPHAMKTARAEYTIASGSSTQQALVPGDLATIYNLNPLFAQGITGKGQTIAVIEDTNVYSANDWSVFRATFGLAGYAAGSLSQVQPGGCASPGVVSGGVDGEAILDAEWASAAAPDAAIQLASCRDTATTFGGLIALENLLNSGAALPSVVSISYGECEAENGAAANAAFAAAYQQAVAEGVSVFVAAGDQGATSCDAGAAAATHGIGVSGFASTPYNVAVGGTDFGDSYAGSNSYFWSSTNSASFASAKYYIPEIPWNDSCASSLLAGYAGYATSAGANGFCNSSTGLAYYLTTAAGSGGPSGCAIGSPFQTGIVGGSCSGYAKPSWQAGVFGNPGDGVRDIPDVSLFAANGVWGHYFIYCWSDLRNGGATCGSDPSKWSGAGGTSFSSPIMAGIQALVNQHTGSRWGNPNHVLYALGAAEYGGSGNNACQAGNTVAPGNPCVFHDVTVGDMSVDCRGTVGCYGSTTEARGRRTTTEYGVSSTSSSSLTPAFAAASGWDFASGLGSVNAYNLVMNWTTVTPR